MLLQKGEDCSKGWGAFRRNKMLHKDWELLGFSYDKQELMDWVSDWRDYMGIDETDSDFRFRRVVVIYPKQSK